MISNFKHIYRITNAESLKQVEVEFLSSPKGVVTLIDQISSLYDASTLSSLRIYDIEKVCAYITGLFRRMKRDLFKDMF